MRLFVLLVSERAGGKAHSRDKYNENYYKYCLHILYYNLRKENLPLYTIQDVWDEFLFYNIQESKLYPKILDLQLKDIK